MENIDRPETEEEVNRYGTLQSINVFVCALSCIGCATVVFCYCALPKLRKFIFRLIIYLSICDFWFCFASFLGHPHPKSTQCIVQASFSTFFGLASIIWTMIIAVVLQKVVIQMRIDMEDYEGMFHVLGWGIPFVALLLAALVAGFGDAGFWCWIQDTAIGNIIRMLVFYLPLWISVPFCYHAYYGLSRAVKMSLQRSQGFVVGQNNAVFGGSDDRNTANARGLNRLMLLPFILAFCWTCGTVNRFLTMIIPGFNWYPLDVLTVLFGSMQGFLNALVYASTPSVRDAFFDRVDIALSSWRSHRAATRGSGKRTLRMDDDVDGIFDIGDLSDDEPAVPMPQSYGRNDGSSSPGWSQTLQISCNNISRIIFVNFIFKLFVIFNMIFEFS